MITKHIDIIPCVICGEESKWHLFNGNWHLLIPFCGINIKNDKSKYLRNDFLKYFNFFKTDIYCSDCKQSLLVSMEILKDE